MTDTTLRNQRDAALALLDRLIRRGRELLDRAAADAYDLKNASVREADVRLWQADCAAAINELAGGSKAHWLSRAYSSALLVRSADGGAPVSAPLAEIVMRILDVIEQAVHSLSTLDEAAISASIDQPQPRRFEFVHNAQLRPVLEQAFVETDQAFATGDFERALMTSCGIIEAIVTDALEHVRLPPSRDDVSQWSFDARIAAAEAAGLIRGGCARLTAVARAYRDASRPPVSERDAKLAGQVLRIVMRDLDPGR